MAIVSVGLVALGASVGLTRLRGVPVPEAADEFSYLLAADTFVHGRLANPPHPLWQYFDSPHVLQQPTYASKYQPGPGLALAFGRWFTGDPIVGVWITTTPACVAVTWALYGWLEAEPPRIRPWTIAEAARPRAVANPSKAPLRDRCTSR